MIRFGRSVTSFSSDTPWLLWLRSWYQLKDGWELQIVQMVFGTKVW
jgi:hypothetical protein